MKTAIILHGRADKEDYFDSSSISESNRHWLPWIQKQLTAKGILAQTPEMPDPYDPDYKKWCSIFELFPIDEKTILVGHSCGGGFLVRWLSENKIKAGKVVLVAPWLDPEHEHTTGIFDFEIDEAIAERTDGLHLIYSNDDWEDVLASVETIKSKIKNLQVIELTGKKHLTFGSMGTVEFPELRDILLN